MPLVVATLAAELSSIFMGHPNTGADAAFKIAGAYDNYCKTAMAPPGLPVFTGVEKTTFQGLLTPSLISAEAGNPTIVAQAMASAIQAYWLTPPVVFIGGPAAGMVTAVPGAMAIVSALSGILSNTGNTEAVAGQQIATQFDIATKTVLVTFTTPPPPAGPPPPAMVI